MSSHFLITSYTTPVASRIWVLHVAWPFYHSVHRPANTYNNISCESFIKTLQREEIYAHEHQDLDHLRSSSEEFIERYYNQNRLHSALDYRSPEELKNKLGEKVH